MFNTSDLQLWSSFGSLHSNKKMSLPSVIDDKYLSHLYLPFIIQEVLAISIIPEKNRNILSKN